MPDVSYGSAHMENVGGRHLRGRFVYTLITLLATVALVGWGGFVTSIDAGLAVPDWPTSFNSYDPFNPWPEWWTLTPVLAEHGHRLLGALVGLLTIGLAAWTWAADDRQWMRILGVSALVLVIVQGVLGGLRVVWLSLNLAVVHACVAQLFFALIAAMALFVSHTWRQHLPSHDTSPQKVASAYRMALIVAFALYLQIILGAFLRHPGTGINTTLAMLHITGAIVVTALIGVLVLRNGRPIRSSATGRIIRLLGVLVVVQVALGLTAYLVLLDERGMVVPSNLQVVVNTSHLLFGFFLFTSAVMVVLMTHRMRTSPEGGGVPRSSTKKLLI